MGYGLWRGLMEAQEDRAKRGIKLTSAAAATGGQKADQDSLSSFVVKLVFSFHSHKPPPTFFFFFFKTIFFSLYI
jgi:hypothetical protein